VVRVSVKFEGAERSVIGLGNPTIDITTRFRIVIANDIRF